MNGAGITLIILLLGVLILSDNHVTSIKIFDQSVVVNSGEESPE